MQLASRVSTLELSVTLALDAKARELASAGRDIVNMSVGEPDFAAPKVAQDASVAKIRSGEVRYGPAAGQLPLRAALARELTETRSREFAPENVVVCHSAKHALSGALMATLEAGDEVLIPYPAWVSYVQLVRIAGAVPVGVLPVDGVRPNLEGLRRAITPRTRLILINSPNNPSGYVYEDGEIEAVLALAKEHGLWLLSDEIYRRLVFEGAPAASPATLDGDGHTIVVDGASKCFAMTGYRIGFAAGPKEVIGAIARLHSQMTGAPNAISQAGYQAAVEVGTPPEFEHMLAAFRERRAALLEGLERLGLETPEPRGAFYVFPDIGPYLDERGSVGFCEDLLEREGLAIVPGAAFGMDRHVRLSYATDLKNIHQALDRLGSFLQRG